MRIIYQLNEMTETARGWLTGGSVGLVPVMSHFALHEGHSTLVQAARDACEICIVAIIRTPLLSVAHGGIQSPRELTGDLQFLRNIGVDAVFIPQMRDLYPPEFSTYVTLVGPLVDRLEAMKSSVAVREFATMMTKLFLLVRPDFAYFGQKDAQQAAVIRQIVRDLNIDVRLCVLPTVRESNGLALSGRNRNLSRLERRAATALYQSLLAAKARIEKGERQAAMIEQVIIERIAQEPLVTLEYIAICHPDTFVAIQEIHPGTLLAVGAQVGSVHLADNILWMENGEWRT